MLLKEKAIEPLGSVWKQTIPGIKCFKNFKQMEDYSCESHEKENKNKLIFWSYSAYSKCHLVLFNVRSCCITAQLCHDHAETWKTALFSGVKAAADCVSPHSLVVIMSFSGLTPIKWRSILLFSVRHADVVMPWLPQQQCWIIAESIHLFLQAAEMA